MSEHYTLFESPLGSIGLVWNARGVTGLLLPERTTLRTEQAILARHPGAAPSAPPAPIRQAIRRIQALLAGRSESLEQITLDLSKMSPFYRAVYEAARKVGPGETHSYGGLARVLGRAGAARAVGQALGRNPIAIIVPCHRILAQNGSIGGFTAPGGTKTKTRLLMIERSAAPSSPARAGAPNTPAAKREKSDARRASGPSTSAARRAKAGSESVPPALLAVSASAARARALSESALALSRIEPRFRAIIERAGPVHIDRRRRSDVFLALAKAITHQQLSGKAAASIWARVSSLGGGLSAELAASAPLPLLRSAGLSEAKALSLRDLAEKVVSGAIPERRALAKMSDEEIIERVTTVRGVGRWTVEMFLIFDLGRPDVLSTGDYGVRKGYSLVFGLPDLPTPKELAAYGQRWAPHRTAATWYLWRALEHAP